MYFLVAFDYLKFRICILPPLISELEHLWFTGYFAIVVLNLGRIIWEISNNCLCNGDWFKISFIRIIRLHKKMVIVYVYCRLGSALKWNGLLLNLFCVDAQFFQKGPGYARKQNIDSKRVLRTKWRQNYQG